MKKYTVTLPVHGVAYSEIELPNYASEDDIYNAAVEDILSRPRGERIEAWEMPREILRGNIMTSEHPYEWEYESVDIDDDEDELDNRRKQ